MSIDYDLLILLFTGIIVVLFSLYIIRVQPLNIEKNRADLDRESRDRLKRKSVIIGWIVFFIGIGLIIIFAYYALGYMLAEIR